MARVFKVSVELHAPSAQRPDYCIESFEQVRTAKPNRVLHFGLGYSPTPADVAFVGEVIATQLEDLIVRLVGVQLELES